VTVEAAIVQTARDYVAAFNTLRPEAVARFYHEPCMVIGQRAVVWSSHADVERAIGSLMESLRARNFGRTEWASFRVKEQSDGVAIGSGVAIRSTTDGAELERVGATYVYRRTDDGWKIAAVWPQAPEMALEL
jgi:ketosteroid isomerase-like protein